MTFKSAVDFLKDDPLSLNDACSISSMSSTSSAIMRISPHSRKRSSSLSTNVISPPTTPSCSAVVSGNLTIYQRSMSPPCNGDSISESSNQTTSGLREIRHRKSVSADLCSLARYPVGHTETSFIDHNRMPSPWNRRDTQSPNLVIRPRIVLPKTPPPEAFPPARRKSTDWTSSEQSQDTWHPDGKSMYPHPLVSTTSPTISQSEKFMSSCDKPPAYDTCHGAVSFMSRRTGSRPSSMIMSSPPPKIINVQNTQGLNDRYPRRPRSFCLEAGTAQKENGIGDFLSGLQNLGGDVVGKRTGEIRSLRRW